MRYRKILLLAASIAVFTTFAAMSYPENSLKKSLNFDDDTPLSVLLEKFGEKPVYKQVQVTADAVEQGRALLRKGFTTAPNSKKTPRQSKFFVCTSCHNVQKEFDDLSIIHPEARLDYAVKKGIPFLQASTFYGIVNRTSFFNGDYQKKYENSLGIKEANKDLSAAINFCAVNNAQGRRLKEWEINSILAYFQTLELKVSDLKISADEKLQIQNVLNAGINDKTAIDLLKSKYAVAMPATFLKIPRFEIPDPSLYNDNKRLKDGKAIYEQACLNCHFQKKYSFFGLDKELLTFKALEKATRTENYIFSPYFLVREGLSPRMGHRFHMPLFTAEKMSPEQLESLYLYISAMAKKKYKE